MAEIQGCECSLFIEEQEKHMKIMDMHCDTISELAERGGELRENKGQLDLKRMRESGYLVQNFALFVDIGKAGTPTPWERVCALYEVYRRELEKNKDRIAPVLWYEDILKNEAGGKLSALLTVEEGAVCGGSLERLRELYDMGVRMLTLTWNYRNELGWPAVCRRLGQSRENVGFTQGSVLEKVQEPGKNVVHGLTETGRSFVMEMERIGMIPDVSHLSDAGFDAVWECTKKPFVASHSNARAVCSSLRNLSDDRIRKLAERGGCMGLNYYDKFLVDGGSSDPEVLWEAIVQQARHITDIGGMEVLGLGSDFDGIPANPAIPGAEALPLLWERLKTAGFTESRLDGIFWGNVMRVYRETL